MGMPVRITVLDGTAPARAIIKAMSLLRHVDQIYSTYKTNSVISRINRGELALDELPAHVTYVLEQCEAWRQRSDGYFNVWFNGQLDPSGFVKGWAIGEVATLLRSLGHTRFLVEVGGDIQTAGLGPSGPWRIAITNPLVLNTAATFVFMNGGAVATSGTYERGLHIYNPKTGTLTREFMSLTVIGKDIASADAAATAAFSMGHAGLDWLMSQGFEALAIDDQGHGFRTRGFLAFEEPDAKRPF